MKNLFAQTARLSLAVLATSMFAAAAHAQALQVINTTPVAGATDVSRNGQIVFEFSTQINPRTVASNWVDLLNGPNGHRSVDFAGDSGGYIQGNVLE